MAERSGAPRRTEQSQGSCQFVTIPSHRELTDTPRLEKAKCLNGGDFVIDCPVAAFLPAPDYPVTTKPRRCYPIVTERVQARSMQSYPENGLALEDLLRGAAEHRITAALDLRSDLAAGRIDIVRGEVVDAVYGGLACEAAIHAALNSTSLRILRGRTPRLSAPRRVRSSTLQIVRDWQSRLKETVANDSIGRRSMGAAGGVRNRPQKGFLWQRVLFYFVATVVAVSTFAAGRSNAKWLRFGMDQAVAAPASPSEAAQCSTRPQLPSDAVIRVKVHTPADQYAQRIDVLIDDQGRAVGAKFEHSGPATHDTENATLEALRQVHFAPARCNGANTSSWANVRVELVSPEGSTAPLAQL